MILRWWWWLRAIAAEPRHRQVAYLGSLDAAPTFTGATDTVTTYTGALTTLTFHD